jgi:esterase/lipase
MFRANRTNNILRGGLIVVGCFGLISLVFIWLVDYEFIRYKVLDSQYLFRLCLSLVAVFISLLITRWIVIFLAKRTNKKYCEQFKKQDDLGIFQETRPHWFFGNKRDEKSKVVLFLHAFGSSPHDFNGLYDELEKSGICYIAPNILGFGVEVADLLEKVCYKDWLREVLGYYDMLASLFDEVVVFGNSMGGILAAYIAEKREPAQVILTGPGIFSADEDLKFRRIVTNKYLMAIVSFVIPYFPKPLRPNRVSTIDARDDKDVDSSFQYLVLPFNSIRQCVGMQDLVGHNLDKISDHPLLLLYGEHDQVTNCDKLIDCLKKGKAKFKYHCMPNSAHTILIDYDQDKAISLIMDFIKVQES